MSGGEVPPEVLALLVCPVCRGPLQPAPGRLSCPVDQLAFPVVNGVPHLTFEDKLKKRKARR